MSQLAVSRILRQSHPDSNFHIWCYILYAFVIGVKYGNTEQIIPPKDFNKMHVFCIRDISLFNGMYKQSKISMVYKQNRGYRISMTISHLKKIILDNILASTDYQNTNKNQEASAIAM
jgi:hypothetical protein